MLRHVPYHQQIPCLSTNTVSLYKIQIKCDTVFVATNTVSGSFGIIPYRICRQIPCHRQIPCRAKLRQIPCQRVFNLRFKICRHGMCRQIPCRQIPCPSTHTRHIPCPVECQLSYMMTKTMVTYVHHGFVRYCVRYCVRHGYIHDD